jgi:hypothetical protein
MFYVERKALTLMVRNYLLLTLLVLSAVAVPTAKADTFTFNIDYCGNPCINGTTGGTVVLTQTATNIVDVLVTLQTGLTFHKSNGAGTLNSFVFNILNNPSLTLTSAAGAPGLNQIKIINGGGSTWSFVQPATNANGAGSTFGYALDCAPSAGGCAGSPSVLEFQINVSGLTVASLETRNGAVVTQGKKNIQTVVNVDFAANVANGTCTGMIGAGNGTNQSAPATIHSGTPCATPGGGSTVGTVPEPTSFALMGTVAAIALGGLRRKLRKHLTA